MFFIKKIQNTKKKFYKFLLVLSFIISWISIGTDYNGLFLLSSNEEVSLSQIINFMRVALNLFFFPVLCFMFFINMTKFISSFYYTIILFFVSDTRFILYFKFIMEFFIYHIFIKYFNDFKSCGTKF